MVGRSIVIKETEKDVVSELCRIIEQCAKVCLTFYGGWGVFLNSAGSLNNVLRYA